MKRTSHGMSPLFAVFLTVFVDMLGFGLLIPDLQIRADNLGAAGWVRGAVLAVFSLAQLLAAAPLGRLSDRIGRKRILLITASMSCLSYLVYSQATVLWVMFLSRILCGIGGSNVGVAFALAADVTKPEERAKGLGLVGAAFGLGFIFGPPFGGMLIQVGGGNPLLLGLVAASLCVVNVIVIWKVLPETVSNGASSYRGGIFAPVIQAFQNPALSLLLTMFFVANFAFANLESTFILLSEKEFHLDELHSSYILMWVGIVIAIMQGVVLPRFVKKFGEVKLLRLGYLFLAPALFMVPFARPWVPALLVAMFLGIGSGFANPSLSSLISRTAGSDIQGGTFGITQSLGALGRIVAPMVGNFAFDYGHWIPYAIAGTLTAIPLLLAWWVKMPDRPAGEVAVAG
ncbi:MAG: MFS transporter [Armatimonadetes bacterium]|nr:MFS transporter [Armatimonadota bacterium]